MIELLSMTEEEYRNFTESRKNTHFLQSYEWGQVSKERNLIPYYLGLKVDGEFKCSALLLKKCLPLGYSYFYIPRGYTIDYTDEDLLKKFTLEIKKWCKNEKCIFFRIDPDVKLHTIDSDANVIDGENNYKLVEYLKQIGFKRKKLTKYFETMQPRFTFRIPLNNSIEEIEDRYSTTTLQRIKKAEKNGIFVTKGTKEDLKEFISLMKMTELRQNFYSHTQNFYNTFYDIFKKSDYVDLYLGKIDLDKTKKELLNRKEILENEFNEIKDIDNKKANSRKKEIDKELTSIINNLKNYENNSGIIVVSAYLIVKYGNKSWALYAANDMNYKGLFANYLVYKTQIRDAFNEGKEIFDVFGTIGEPNSKSNLVGLHEFKKKWGGEYTEFIGEFDYITNKFMYFIYIKLIPLYHKIVRAILRKKNR